AETLSHAHARLQRRPDGIARAPASARLPGSHRHDAGGRSWSRSIEPAGILAPFGPRPCAQSVGLVDGERFHACVAADRVIEAHQDRKDGTPRARAKPLALPGNATVPSGGAARIDVVVGDPGSQARPAAAGGAGVRAVAARGGAGAGGARRLL